MPKPKLEITLAGPEIIELAEQVIAEHHPALRGTVAAKIRIVMTSKENTKSGLDTGRSLALPLVARVAESRNPHFILVLPAPLWTRLNDAQKVALLDRRLCALWWDEQKAKTLPPDTLGYYKAELKRHGFWCAEIEDTARFWQQTLPGMGDDEQETADGVQLEPAEAYIGPDDEQTLQAGGMELVDDSEIEGPPADLDQDLTEIEPEPETHRPSRRSRTQGPVTTAAAG